MQFFRPADNEYLISDRHADDLMRTYDSLTSHLRVEGFDVSKALRYSFFRDCLKTTAYKQYRFLNNLYLSRREADVSFCRTSDHLYFVTDSPTSRVDKMIARECKWLETCGVPVGVIWSQHSRSRSQRLRGLLTVNTPCIGISAAAKADARAAAAALSKVFNFPAPFMTWFMHKFYQVTARYRKAVRFLEDLKAPVQALFCVIEYGLDTFTVLSAAHHLKVPSVLIQHGFLGQEWLHYPIMSEKICVWGEVDAEWYRAYGLDTSRIEVTGTARIQPIESDHRARVRQKYNLAPDERAIVFYPPHLHREYHNVAAAFLKSARVAATGKTRWFVRPHPVQNGEVFEAIYKDFEIIPTSTSIDDALALSDVVLHDYSTVGKEASYLGLQTVCLELQSPYPTYYRKLLHNQPVFSHPDELASFIPTVDAGNHPIAGGTPLLAYGGRDAAERISRVILSFLR